ncbi:MAG: insulinase family protein [Bacteroidales bacterium]|nr:insulinase family protein [Bacteroidales bacterium]
MRNEKINAGIGQLQNGLRVAWRRVPGSAVDYCGLVVRAGSRDDGEEAYGLAHFVEHTIFKGTQRRSSWHIINRMERVGGELNAYTTKEETVVYTAAPTGNLSRAMDLLADLIENSRFPQSELDKEREVVADEINSYLDTPSEAVYDDFEELIFAGTPLAHNILGNLKALATFDSEMCQRYLHRWYRADNMTFFYCGPASEAKVMAMAERYFSTLSGGADSHKVWCKADLTQQIPFDKKKEIGSHQAHTVLGAIIGGMYAEDRHAVALLTNILGGPGMNSLLNLELREKRGLVYSVEASTGLYTDCGLFTVYYGCDPDDVGLCDEIVRKQVADLARTPLSSRVLAAAKKQYLGQLAVASDNRESLAISTGRAANYYHNLLSPSQVAERINRLTAEDICAAAATIENLSKLTLE